MSAVDFGNRPPRGVDWAQSVIADLEADGKLSARKRATSARMFADRGNYTPEARDVLRQYADKMGAPN